MQGSETQWERAGFGSVPQSSVCESRDLRHVPGPPGFSPLQLEKKGLEPEDFEAAYGTNTVSLRPCVAVLLFHWSPSHGTPVPAHLGAQRLGGGSVTFPDGLLQVPQGDT